MSTIVGENIKYLRKSEGKTRASLAEFLKVTPQTVYRWEKGDRSPDYDTLTQIAEFFDISPVYFLEKHNSDEESRPNAQFDELGAVIKYYREQEKISLQEFAQKLSISTATAEKWETNGSVIPAIRVPDIANALSLPLDYLFGWTEIKRFPEPNASNTKMLEIPLLSMEAVASCGAGNGLSGVDVQATDTIFIEQSDLHRYDDLRKPFAIHTEGDSMEGAGLEEGSVAVINPAEDVISGDMALVVWNDNWFVKWVVWNPDGSVELRSANPNYGTIKVDKEYAVDSSWFRVVGKVVSIIKRSKPRRAF